jgi:hypothetical protein
MGLFLAWQGAPRLPFGAGDQLQGAHVSCCRLSPPGNRVTFFSADGNYCPASSMATRSTASPLAGPRGGLRGPGRAMGGGALGCISELREG